MLEDLPQDLIINLILSDINPEDRLNMRLVSKAVKKMVDRFPGPPRPINIAIGNCHTILLSENGTPWAMGTNYSGQLGLGHSENCKIPTQIESSGFKEPEKRITAVATGKNSHTILLSQDGTLWASGSNAFGQLGLGNTKFCHVPTRIEFPGFKETGKLITAVAMGYEHTIFFSQDGTLWATGLNAFGQLGLGDTKHRLVPTQIEFSGFKETGKRIIAVVTGSCWTIFLSEDRTLWATGSNDNGQLGLGDTKFCHVPTRIEFPGFKETGKRIIAVVTGTLHTIFLSEDGTLWATGSNDNGQLGLGHNKDCHVPTRIEFPGFKEAGKRIIAVAAGGDHTIFLSQDGTLWATGLNASGQLGLGHSENCHVPTRIEFPGFKETGKRIIAVAAGGDHTIFLSQDGTLWASGANYDGQLGLGDNENRWVPTRIDTLPNNPYHEAVSLRKPLLQSVIKLQEVSTNLSELSKKLKNIETILKDAAFYPAIPRALLKTIEILNPQECGKIQFNAESEKGPFLTTLFNETKKVYTATLQLNVLLRLTGPIKLNENEQKHEELPPTNENNSENKHKKC